VAQQAIAGEFQQPPPGLGVARHGPLQLPLELPLEAVVAYLRGPLSTTNDWQTMTFEKFIAEG
jgi:hypothetical protein